MLQNIYNVSVWYKVCPLNFLYIKESYNYSTQLKFICIVFFTMQIIAKQLYRKSKFLHYIK